MTDSATRRAEGVGATSRDAREAFSVPPPIVHLTVREGLSSVFLSQVAKPMRYLAEQGLDVRLAIVCPFGEFVRPASRAAWRKRGRELDDLDLNWARLPSLPSRVAAWALDRAMLAAWLMHHMGRRAPFIVHCRGTAAAQLAGGLRHRFPNLRIVADCRGVEGPERAQFRGIGPHSTEAEKLEVRKLEDAQHRALAQADFVLCVSRAMKAYLVESWGLDASSIEVIPCCYTGRRATREDPDVAEIRRKYGFEGKIVFAHAASEAPWQRADDVAALCGLLAARLPNAHFLFLTWKPDKVAAQFRDCGVDLACATILSVRHEDVAPHLAAADIGILFRDSSLVSRVSSPVKFAEYLAAGLPVVLTPNVGDYSALVAAEEVGIVMSHLNVDDSVVETVAAFAQQPGDRLRDIQRRARAAADRHLSWPNYLDTFHLAYSSAAKPALGHINT